MDVESLSACAGKIKYPSKKEVLEAFKRMGSKRGHYKCAYCKSWHIGTSLGKTGKPEWKPQSVKRGKRK